MLPLVTSVRRAKRRSSSATTPRSAKASKECDRIERRHSFSPRQVIHSCVGPVPRHLTDGRPGGRGPSAQSECCWPRLAWAWPGSGRLSYGIPHPPNHQTARGDVVPSPDARTSSHPQNPSSSISPRASGLVPVAGPQPWVTGRRYRSSRLRRMGLDPAESKSSSLDRALRRPLEPRGTLLSQRPQAWIRRTPSAELASSSWAQSHTSSQTLRDPRSQPRRLVQGHQASRIGSPGPSDLSRRRSCSHLSGLHSLSEVESSELWGLLGPPTRGRESDEGFLQSPEPASSSLLAERGRP